MILKSKRAITFIAATCLAAASCGVLKQAEDATDGASLLDDPESAVVKDTDAQLELPGRLNLLIVDSQSTSLALTQSGTDYAKDKAKYSGDSHVREAALESLETVNMILCIIKYTGYWLNVNKGPYLASIPSSTCEGGGGGESGGGESGEGSTQSGSNAEEFMLITTDVKREKNRPIEVFLWVPGDKTDDEPIHVKATIAKGASDQYPFGLFTMSFGQEGMVGGLSIGESKKKGNLLLKFAEKGGRDGREEKRLLAFEVDIKKKTGVGSVDSSRTENGQLQSSTGKIGIDGSTYMISNDEGEVCKSLSDVMKTYHGYKLYNSSDETRVVHESGFPLTNAAGANLWASYYGIHAPEDIAITDGMTVTRRSFDDDEAGAGESFTVKTAPGKLIKRTKSVISNIDGQGGFNYHDGQNSYLVKVDAASGKFIATHKRDNSNHNSQWETDTSGKSFTMNQGDNYLWSEALGGSVVVNRNGSTVSAIVFKETLHSLDVASNLTLYCSGGMHGGCNDASGNNLGNGTHAYTFKTSDLTLYYGSNKMVAPSSGSNNNNGVWLGPLVTSSSAASNAWGAEESYMWSAGSNNWQQLAVLINSSGTPHKFAAPMDLGVYVHSEANDLNGAKGSHFGESFLLRYEGGNNIQGIPREQQESGHHAPLFSMVSGTKVGTDDAYKLLGMWPEIIPSEVDASQCSSIDLSSVPALPDASTFTAPNNGAVPETETVQDYSKDF